jgi:DNA-binding NarL/FixJ family response regulator
VDRILVFEASQEKRKALGRELRARFGWRVWINYYDPRDVFTKKLPEKALVAFFTLDSMYGVEAARKLGGIRGRIPIVAVSDKDIDSTGYCQASYDFGTCRYYLLRPFDGAILDKALKACAIGR